MKTNVHSTFAALLVMIIFTIIAINVTSCSKKSDNNNNITLTNPLIGKYKDLSGNGCRWSTDNTKIESDCNGRYYMYGVDYWCCPQKVALTVTNSTNFPYVINDIYEYNGQFDTINANGYMRGDTLMLFVNNTAAKIFPNYLHKYVKI